MTSSRRHFLAGGAAIAASRLSAQKGPNDQINLGFIGVGRRGTGHVSAIKSRGIAKGDVKIVALCDVYQGARDVNKEATGAAAYEDYRELLQRKDLDAVIIASPDHWHFRQAIDALRAGKDVYVEKPMTHSMEEARQLAEAVRQTGRVLQVGNQGASEDQFHIAREWIAKGAIGKLLWMHAGFNRNSIKGEWTLPHIPDANEKTVNWRMWLGDRPYRPFNPELYRNWRKYFDFGGGIATDLFYHKLAPLMMTAGAEFPIRVAATGGIYVFKGDREIPDTLFIAIDYPGEYSLVLESSMANRTPSSFEIRGHEATIELHGTAAGDRPAEKEKYVIIRAEQEFGDKFQAAHGQSEIRVNNRPRPDHMENFLECVRTRQQPNANAGDGYRATAVIELAQRSYREQKMMVFDPRTMKVVDNPAPRRDAVRPA
ncbi:MAG: Gfo/Idh/MocA family oxidoreductase [Acidobacteriota bacterium]